MLVALVARHQGARVVLSEINPYRIELARQFGLNAINPTDQDLKQYAFDQTDGGGADVVFEVRGSTAGAQVMTELPRVRGRIVVVAIFSEPLKVDLFKFFWRELKLLGVRVYEHEDFEQAIQLASQRALPLDELITATYPIDRTGEAFKRMDQGGDDEGARRMQRLNASNRVSVRTALMIDLPVCMGRSIACQNGFKESKHVRH